MNGRLTLEPDDVPAVLAAVDSMCHDTITLMAAKLSPDVDGMVVLLQDLRRAMAQLAWACEELEDQIVRDMPAKEMVVDGVGQITLRTGTKRTAWDNDGIVDLLVARISDNPQVICDPDTGEVLPPHEVVALALRAFLEVARPSWRTTQLRSYRIDPDEYATTTYGRKSVQLPKVEPWPAHQQQEESE